MHRTLAHSFAALSLALAATGAQAAQPAEQLWFADRQVSAFYALDPVNHQVILVTEPGPQGRGRPVRSVRTLAQGEQYSVALSGSGHNALTAVLTVRRGHRGMEAAVATAIQDPAAEAID